MIDVLVVFGKKMIPVLVLLLLGASISGVYYFIKKRDLFGGFIGGMVVGVIGAIIGAFLIDLIFTKFIVRILTKVNNFAGINVIAGLLGAFVAVYIMNKLSHDKERKKY